MFSIKMCNIIQTKKKDPKNFTFVEMLPMSLQKSNHHASSGVKEV